MRQDREAIEPSKKVQDCNILEILTNTKMEHSIRLTKTTDLELKHCFKSYEL